MTNSFPLNSTTFPMMVRGVFLTSWDEEEYLEKDWVRVDDGSYPVDCLDSDEYSIQPFKPMLIKVA